MNLAPEHIVALVLGLTGALDIFTTMRALKAGYEEDNAIVQWAFAKFGPLPAMIGGKVLQIALAAGAFSLGGAQGLYVVAGIGILLNLYASVHNLRAVK